MEEQPRFHSSSFTFLTGFGVGIFAGVLLAILAFAMVQDNEAETLADSLLEPTTVLASISLDGTATPDGRPRTKSALDIRLGPGSAFAVIGTIARAEAVEVVGRDAAATWAAIRFPPGSAARGWVLVSDLDGLASVESFAVVLPTPLPRSLSTVSPTSNNLEAGNAPTNGGRPPSTVRPASPSTSTPAPPRTTPTPGPNIGPTDLVVTRASLLSDGRVQVVIGNRGPGDVLNKSVFVVVRDLTLRSEQLVTNQALIPVGAVVTLQTSGFRVTRETDIQVIVDPFGSLQDPERGNNQLSVGLTPAAVPTPTKSPFE